MRLRFRKQRRLFCLIRVIGRHGNLLEIAELLLMIMKMQLRNMSIHFR